MIYCIFHFYDQQGEVRFHVKYLLKELSSVADKLIIVVNGYLSEKARSFFLKYSKNILIRENVGYDAGGYRDVIIDVLEEGDWISCDSLILCNDTFYGPFIPLKQILKKMEPKCLDLWGMDRDDKGMFSQIHSYFLVIGKKMLKSGDLRHFFSERKDYFLSCNIYEAWIQFEYALSCFAKDRGFCVGSFAFGGNRSVYYSPNYTVCVAGVPVLKRKFFLNKYYDGSRLSEIIDYLRKESDYPWEDMLLEEQIRNGTNYFLDIEDCGRKEKDIFSTIPDISEEVLREFCNDYSTLYVYGAGLFAQMIAYRLNQWEIPINGFLVSEEKRMTQELAMNVPILVYNNKYLEDDNTGIIVGMNYYHSTEVMEMLEKKNVFFIWNELNLKMKATNRIV